MEGNQRGIIMGGKTRRGERERKQLLWRKRRRKRRRKRKKKRKVESIFIRKEKSNV